MRLVGILCFFDEQASWLAASVASFARLGMDDIVVVDGAYALFPDGTPRSGAEQHEVLAEIVRPFGMGLTLHVPNQLWASEVEKRSKAFALAEQITTEDDWYVVFDADEFSEPFDLKRALSTTDKLVGECDSWERLDSAEAKASGRSIDRKNIRRFFRALRGLRCDTTHTTYRAGDLVLRGFGEDELVEAEPVPMLVEHRWNYHDPQRRLRQETYYRIRDTMGIEARKCAHCDRRAVSTAPIDFNPGPKENDRLDVGCQWVEVCENHLAEVLEENERRLEELEVNPDSVMTRIGFDLSRARWLAKASQLSA